MEMNGITMDMPNWFRAIPKNRIHSLRSYDGSFRFLIADIAMYPPDEKW
jgi:hypothetical protein